MDDRTKPPTSHDDELIRKIEEGEKRLAERAAEIKGFPQAQPAEHIEQFFVFAHLPPHLQAVSEPFTVTARHILTLPRNPERTVALRKLLEAKDAAVRAALAKG
jgi:hypothetical protein